MSTLAMTVLCSLVANGEFPELSCSVILSLFAFTWKSGVVRNVLLCEDSFLFSYRGQVINMRYLEYFEKILHFIKDRILVYHG